MKANTLIIVLGFLLVLPSFAQVCEASQVPKVQTQQLQPREDFSRPKPETTIESRMIREGIRERLPKVPSGDLVPIDQGIDVFNQKQQQDADLDGVLDTIDTDNTTPHIYVRLRNSHCNTYPNCPEVDEGGVSSDYELGNTGVTLRYTGHNINQGQGIPHIQIVSGNTSQAKYTSSFRYTNINGTNYVMIHLHESPEFVSLLITPFVSIPWSWLNPSMPIWTTYQYIHGFLNPYFVMLQSNGYPHPSIGEEIILVYTGPIVN